MGSIALRLLNCGDGDKRFTFDTSNKQEAKEAEEMITDLMRKGYAILVDDGTGTLSRVKKFNKKIGAYIIGDKEVSAEKVEPQVVAPQAGG